MSRASTEPADPATAHELLGVYLDDHWAGAGAGTALARSLRSHNEGTPWVDELRRLADDIEADERELARLRSALDVTGGGVKRAIARVGERVRLLKPNGALVGHSPLSRVVELEALMSGVAGKRQLWSSLEAILDDGEKTVAGVDVARLRERADEQLDRLRQIHADAARIAFAAAAPGRVRVPT